MDKSLIAVATYNKIADKYTELYFGDKTDLQVIDKFISYLPKNSKVLDAGCGPGQFSQYIQEKGFDIEGIDLSTEMLAIAKQKVPGVRFEKMDIRNITYPEQEFNGILAAYSLIHIPTEQLLKVLEGFNRVLKSQGVVLVIVQKGEPDKIIDEPLKRDEKTFINFFSQERLTKFLTEAEFEIIYQEERKSEDPDQLSEELIYTIARKII